MVFDIGSTTVPWPGLLIAISAGSIICTVLLLVMCTCCFKTKIPQYRAKLTKNVVAKEDIRRYTPEKRKPGNRETRMHSLIFDGAPIGSGRWDDLFVKGEEIVPNNFKPDRPTARANPPDVIMHPALLRVLNNESRNVTQREAFIVPTNSVASPSKPSHPSNNLQELIQQSEVAEEANINGTSLANFPIRREASQEFNRDGSILYYKPRRDVALREQESAQKPGSPTKTSRDPTRSDDPVASRIQELKQQRKSTHPTPRKLPRFNRTSGEWDNVPKPGWSVETPPPVPSRNYSIGESDVLTDCSETMPRPVKDNNYDPIFIDVERTKVTEAERTKLNVIRESSRQSSAASRQTSRSSGASNRNLPRSPDTARLKNSNVKNPSPISDTVFIPNGNPAHSHVSVTPPRHNPRKESRRFPSRNKDDSRLGVMSDGSFELIDETKRLDDHHNKIDDVTSSQHNGQQHRFKPGVYYRPKPYYHHLKAPEKRFSDASDYSDIMFEKTNGFVAKPPTDDEPYFFRSRWSSAFEVPAEARRHANEARLVSRDWESRKKWTPRQSDSNESSLDRQLRDNPRQRSSRSKRIARQDIPLPEAPFPYSSRIQRHAPSPPKRSHEPSHGGSPSKRIHATPSGRRPSHPLPLDVVIAQAKDDVLVSPGHQPNYPVDVAKIRRGLQQSSSDNKTKDYHQQQSDHCDRINDTNVCQSTKSLSVPDDPKMRRKSSEYGSLIDILYSYRQNVRQSRVREKPTESPESRLKFEREKLKTKLREVLEPREMQSKNVEMVVETLLFLCEAESSREKKKGSGQRDFHSDTNASKPHSNSFEIEKPTEDKDDANFGVYDVGNYDYYARIRSHSDSRSSLAKNATEKVTPQSSPVFKMTNVRLPSGSFSTPQSTPLEATEKEFLFPTVEELDRILGQEDAPPPVPPRRHHMTQLNDVIPPPIAPRKPKKTLPPSPEENIPNGTISNLEPHKQFLNGKNSEHSLTEQENVIKEPDYAKIRKISSRKRRKSLPSRHLTESEIRWLQNSGGDADKISQNVQQFPRGNTKIVAQPRERAGAFLRDRSLPSPPEPPTEDPGPLEVPLSLDDIPVHETTDAEDIIKAVERKMSQNQIVLSQNNVDQSPLKNRESPKLQTDSEIGTWSSVTSSEIPVPPRRARLHRHVGMSPHQNETPSQSPVFLRKTYQTPPPNGDTRPRDPIAGALSPSRNVRHFQTPPGTPQPIANARRFSSATNVGFTPPLLPSPKIKARNSPLFLSPNKQHSVSSRPKSPQPTPKKSPHHMGFIPNLSRRTSRFVPNIPVMSKRLIQPTSQNEIVVAMESDRRRISRTGEIVYLPDDNDYAIPLDAVTMRSPNRAPLYPSRDEISPHSPLFNLESNSFYPIAEEDDYAVPVNQAPSLLLQQRAYARSMENIVSEYESSV